MATLLEETTSAVEQIQNFAPEELSRETELGTQMGFQEAVDPAAKIIRLYQELPISILPDLPDGQLGQIKERAEQDHRLFKGILEFNVSWPEASQRRDHLIQEIKTNYEVTFENLLPSVAFSATRSVDFRKLQRDALAARQEMEEQAQDTLRALEGQRAEGAQIISSIRQEAAEQGVSQHAMYFKTESDRHKDSARLWKNGTFSCAALLVTYAIL